MESKGPDDTLHMRRMIFNLCNLGMFEGTFSLDAAYMVYSYRSDGIPIIATNDISPDKAHSSTETY